jgi:formylglycine-generating enzyme required for sulfatase activity
VINVSWDDAKEYVAWLSRKTGKAYRLLSEAEWEYAARAGTTTPFSTGERITTDQANFNGNYTYGGSAKGTCREKSIQVGSSKPNAFGLYDMHGNVWEWVEDCYQDSYVSAPADGSVRTSGDCSDRVLRGGSWYYDPEFLRSAYRYWLAPGGQNFNFGFRVGRTLTPLILASLHQGSRAKHT